MTWFSTRLSLVWLALVAVTLLSFETSLFGSGMAGTIVVTIALLKAWTVGWEFMELKHAPAVMRLLFAAWLLAVGVAITFVLFSQAI